MLRLYGIRHTQDHSDSEKGNPLPPHRLLFPINSKGSFICTIHYRIAHTTAFVTPVVEHWPEREIAQWVHPMKDRSDDPSHHERTLFPRSWTNGLSSTTLSLVSTPIDPAERTLPPDRHDDTGSAPEDHVESGVAAAALDVCVRRVAPDLSYQHQRLLLAVLVAPQQQQQVALLVDERLPETLRPQQAAIQTLHLRKRQIDIFKKKQGRKEGNVLFNDALNTFYFYGYMASDIW